MQAQKFSKFHEQVLPHLGLPSSTELKINHVYGGQIGHLVLSPKDFVANGDRLTDLNGLVNCNEEQPEDDDLSKIESDYMAALAGNPHIFYLAKNVRPTVSHRGQRYFRHSIFFEAPLGFTIKVPNAKKHFDLFDDGAEQFEILTLGSPYVAFTEIDDCPKRIFIAHEFREQMRQMLEEHAKDFHLGQVGPSPIHPRIYVLDVSNDEADTATTVHTYDNDLYILVNLAKSEMTIKDIFEDLLHASANELDEFFHLSKLYSYLLDVHEAATRKLRSLVEEYGNMNLSPFFIDIKKISQLRKDLLSIHVSTITIESTITGYEQLQKEFLSGLESSFFFDNLAGYFKRTSNCDIAMAPSFFRTMEYMEKSISAGDVAIRTIFAAMVGAGIGMLVTIFFK